MNFIRRRWLTRHWRRCACGQMRVAPGTRTEIGGFSHGETPCFSCDTYGRPVALTDIERTI